MNISFSWLKRYVNVGELSAEEVGNILTSIGLEVEGVEEHESVRGGLRGVVIGKVLTCTEHTNSDHLHVTTIDLGPQHTPNGPIQIVCGAPNIAAGQTVPVATVGTTLYTPEGEAFVIKKGKIRGEESSGMICSEVELGVGSDASGIMVLPSEVPAGTPAAEYFGVTTDSVISVDITPNRVDATSHLGVARDLHAYLHTHGHNTSWQKPTPPAVEGSGEPVQLNLLSPQACHRYAGVVIEGVKVAESPKWLREALLAIGQKPINNVVDAANYVLHDIGQPLHTFDLATIAGNEVNVRLAYEGEKLVTLDGTERTLTAQDLVIADAQKPLCLAGVMGGINSGVTHSTTALFLEVANFSPRYVRKTARRHTLSSDSSFRFERGLDPNAIPYALRRAVALITEVAGGHVASKVYDLYPTPLAPYQVELSLHKVNALLGINIPHDTVLNILRLLEIEVTKEEGHQLTLQVPRYRYDVTRDIDVIEEIFRIYGYNEFPSSRQLVSTLNHETLTDQSFRLQQLISEQLVGAGFNEILNNSLSREAYYPNNPLKVTVENPLSVDLSTLRLTLLHGGLEAIEFNLNRKAEAIRLYEFGNVYRHSKEGEQSPLQGYTESYRLALWLTGDSAPHNWATPAREVSVFELKATLYNVLHRMGIQQNEIEVKPIEGDSRFEKGEKILLRGGGGVVKWGVVSRTITQQMHDIDVPVYYAELKWNKLLERVARRQPAIKPVPKFPSVRRDFALLLDASVTFAQVEQVARRAEKKLLKGVELFDVYDDPRHLPEGKKSYAVAFALQDEGKTLSDKVIEKTMQRIFGALRDELGAELR